jgi:hypothetical protein
VLCKLSYERQQEYFDKQFMRRYKRKIVWSADDYSVCLDCIYSGYYESGYISDRQVRFLTRQQLHFDEDIDTFQYGQPNAFSEMVRLNPDILKT